MNAYRLRLTICAVAVLLWPAPSRCGEPNWPDHLGIGTASPGGTYHAYGEGLAILTRALDLPVTREVTEGPTQDIELLEAGEAKLGFVTIGIALQAWNATGVWAGKKPARSMRAIFPMFDTPFQLLVREDTATRTTAGEIPCGRAIQRKTVALPGIPASLQMRRRLSPSTSRSQIAQATSEL